MNEKPRESSLSRFLQTEARALDLRAALRNLAEDAGMKFFVFGTFPDADHPGLIENTIETNWPSEMVGRYSSADLLKTSALIRKMRTTGLPVSGSLLLASADAKAQPDPPAEFEGSFTSNLALTAFDLRGSRYVYMISGPSLGSTPEDSGRLLLDLVSTIERYCPGPIQQQSLSSREIECLKWSAAGKSSGETAMILGLSSHTIDTYLRRSTNRGNFSMKIVIFALLAVSTGGLTNAIGADANSCRQIADSGDRLNCYDKAFGLPTAAAKTTGEVSEISWTDLQVDYDDMKGQTVVTSGKFMIMGEQGLLYDRQMGMTAFFVDMHKLPRDQRSLLYSNCGTGCDVRLTGKVQEIMMQRGLTATNVVLD